jgi:GNAT superfamily N-acetyltransferase
MRPTETQRTVEVERTYLKLGHPDDLKSAGVASDLVRVDKVVECAPSFFRFLYTEVGRYYHWVDRLTWTDKQIASHLARKAISVWVMYYAGAAAGYFELERHDDDSTEIAYFGLLPEFIGRGLGKYLLTKAATEAWFGSPTYVWLHTCTLDDPAALPNYLNRGFIPFRQETYLTTIQPGEILRSASLNPRAI